VSDGPSNLPVIDVAPLVGGAGARRAAGDDSARRATAAEIGRACRESGFFYVTGHGVDPALERALEEQSRAFFAQDLERKLAIRMALGGRAWRGYFPVGGELTSGVPDLKEGLYFGQELGDDHPLVRAGVPLHGPNLFPEHPAGYRDTVLAWIAAMTRLGHLLMGGLALSLGLDERFFADRYTADPLVLFRVFLYPPAPEAPDAPPRWGVGEHTDYGVLTILKQDDRGGLQVKSRGRWLDAPAVPGAFVCNIGDMLDRMTAGLYRSTPHRVRNRSGRERLSFPFFFDPGWTAEVRRIELSHLGAPAEARDDRDTRWDGESVHAFGGTYGDYVLSKVSRVFPELQRAVL
jgi:isopenicillin N synthase-like dioxygenase